MISAYLDRFTDSNVALLLVESLQQEFHVAPSELPVDSVVGTWFLITIDNNEITSLVIDSEKTAAMKETIQDRMARLKSNKKSRFKRRD